MGRNKILKDYAKALYNVAEEFGKLMEKEGYWSGDMTLWITEYEAWTVEDMVYILRNADKFVKEIYNSMEALRDDVEAWIDYNVDVADLGIAYINLRSWMIGCPRMSKEEIDKIREIKKQLGEIIGDMETKYGERDDNPQPKHLRTLKKK